MSGGPTTQPNGKHLLDWLDDYHEHTGTISGIVRNLALALVAIVWLFKNDQKTGSIIPLELVWPLCLIVLALILDLSQYGVKAYGEKRLYNSVDKQHKANPATNIADVELDSRYEMASTICFIGKIALTFLAYVLLGFFLYAQIFKEQPIKKNQATVEVKKVDSATTKVSVKGDSININLTINVQPEKIKVNQKPIKPLKPKEKASINCPCK